MPDRIPPTTLGEHLTEIEGQFVRLDEKQKSRNRYLRWGLAVLGAVLVLLSVAVVRLDDTNDKLAKQNDRLEKAIAEIIAVRTGARDRECRRDNEQYQKARIRAREMWLSYIDRSAQASGVRPSGAAAALIEPFLQDQERSVDNEWADRAPRPCTPEAIDAYYEQK